ncbi:Stk1 family PASTA domain-containing Ser/Thr kinase [Microterricola pindariensis]|uniref:Stk1 family PASTA domain-containing Ser/Thr kinase n=1 Tax=Microterricola pindariensis TaxID=478010 RepID=UPI000CEBDC21|nr:Stk1 family PASTA domain-containing Ser/Thr kinase [Microterricola pindariensis]
MSEEGRLIAGRYRVGELIGRGGMSDVHRGTDSRLGRTVAIKLLKPSLASDPAFRTRFRQEAQAAARMAHPTIVRVFDAGEETVTDPSGHETQLPFIVMEYVDGTLLKDIIRQGPLDSTEAVRILEGVLTALEYSHRAGVVHRDIKPGNIMITRNGQVKVMDFGIARAISDSSTTVAQTTAILGTASYFSPEQAKGEIVDARTDLYSTGVVLFEMLTARPPFRGDTPVAVAYQHVSEAAPKPSSFNPKVSPALDAVVARAMTKDRDQRYQSAAEFRSELEMAAAGHVPIHPAPESAATALFSQNPNAVSASELALKQLSEDTNMVRTQRRPPALWIWAGVMSVIVIVITVMLWAMNLSPSTELPPSSREVPALTGQSFAQAQEALAAQELQATEMREASSTVPADQVVRTDPVAGTIVTPNTTIKVYVSTGKTAVAIPDVSNISLADAEAKLTAAGFQLGLTTKKNSPTIAADTVLSTMPAAGTEGHEGDTVDVTISSGLVELPDLTGQTLSAATAILQGPELQLEATPVRDDNCDAQPNDPIVRQSLAPGDVPQRSEVQLTYCAG